MPVDERMDWLEHDISDLKSEIESLSSALEEIEDRLDDIEAMLLPSRRKRRRQR